MKLLLGTVFYLTFLFSVLPSFGQSDISITGFVRNYNAIQLSNDNEILIGRNRLRLDLSKDIDLGRLVISNDLQNLYSEQADSIFYRPREAYLDIYLDKYDIRLGRQMISWGRTEGTAVTDIITPLDLREFLTQDFADIRTGVTAFNITRFFGSNFVQFVVNPVFNANEIPESDSRWFPSSLFPSNLPIDYVEQNQDPELDDVQIAARFAFRNSLKFNFDLAAYYWHFPNPSYNKGLGTVDLSPGNMQLPLSIEFREVFLQSWIGAYSGFYKLTDRLIIKSEAAFYEQRYVDRIPQEIRDLDLANPTLPGLIQAGQVFLNSSDGLLKKRPWLITMAGLQYQWSGWLLSAQYFNEHIFNYDDEILQEQDYNYITLLTQKSFFRDRLSFTQFGRYNFDGNDFWINPELVYDIRGSFNVGAGAHIFGGQTPPPFYGHLSFDFFEDNSFAYMKVEAFF